MIARAAFAAMLIVAASPAPAAISRIAWGETGGGQKVDLYTLRNAHGLIARIATFGATVTELHVPDRRGRMADIVRGFDTLDDYANPAKDSHYYGALVGRYANVIEGAQFPFDGRQIHLIANSGANNLHGGPIGFSRRVWRATAHDGASPSLTLAYLSPDGENGFPGTLHMTVTYTLTADDALRIDYHATADQPAVLNPTNHSYFNLSGHAAGPVLDHRMQIFADRVALRNGQTEVVKGTALDFNAPAPIGSRIDADLPRLKGARGFNETYIIDGQAGELRLAARVTDPASGRVMEMLTTQPGMLLYTANLTTPVIGKSGASYVAHGAFCLETQHYPNSVNIPSFPSTELRPGQVFHEITVFRFLTEQGP